MKKSIFLFVLIVSFFGCSKDLVEKPDNLIDKKVMLDIMYDMSLLDALKYNNPNSLFKYDINPKTYIYQKYKIDSLQFVKSNAYYASDYIGYKDMFDVLNKRLVENKNQVDALVKKETKKENALKKAKDKKIKDSITKAKKALVLKTKKEKDSVSRAKKLLESKNHKK
jgi:hypothetical protein